MSRVLLLFLFCANVAAQPNFILVLTDDQSYGMMGCTGNEVVKTPHLDRLAKDGVLFQNAYVTSAICTPSRISILLSQHERRHGVNFNSGTSVAMDAWVDSYPMVLRNAGYYTGWIGKNHAPVGPGGYESGVMEKSFDYWYAGHGHIGFYPKDRHDIFNDAENETQVEVVTEGMEDFLDPNARKLEGAIKFLESRPADKPFMLSINLNLPHGAGVSSMEQRTGDDEMYKSLYRDQLIRLPEHYVQKNDIEQPKLPPSIHFAEERQKSYAYVDEADDLKERMIRQYQAMTGIDKMMGALRERLLALELTENTVIIFTSDHGLFMGEHGLGGKALCYEKTTHVPMIVYDPRNEGDGEVRDALVQSIDLAPTLLEMAGIEVPDSYQGMSLLPVLADQKSERDYIFTENLWSTHFGNPRCEAVQDQNWKYIRYYKNQNLPASRKLQVARDMNIKKVDMLYKIHDPDIAAYRSYVEGPLEGEAAVYEELYNLKNDPAETNNLATSYENKALLEKMKKVWYVEIRKARGEGMAKVLRYVKD